MVFSGISQLRRELLQALWVGAFCLLAGVAARGEDAPAAADGGMISLAGQAGLPAFLTCVSNTYADAEGMHGGQLATVRTDFFDKDFVLDLAFSFKANERGNFTLGFGDSVHAQVNGPGSGANVTLPGAAGGSTPPKRGQPGDEIVKIPAGSYVIRMEKAGDSVTYAVGTMEQGQFAAVGSKSIASLKAAAPGLDKFTSPLVIKGEGAWKSVRLSVGGKALPGIAPHDLFKVPDDAPMFLLKGAAGLPAGFKCNATTFSDAEGIVGGEISTRDTDLVHKDFVFDLLFHFRGANRAGFNVGLGEMAHEYVAASIDGPDGFNANINISNHAGFELGRFYKSGPNLLRIQKSGNTLTFAMCVDYAGKFEPTLVKVIPDLQAAAPFLSKLNSGLFVSGDGVFDAVRFIVDGKAVTVAVTQPAAATEPAVEVPFFPLTGQSGLPGYLKPLDSPTADGEGLRGQVRTVMTDLIDHDFTFDFIFKTTEGQNAVAVVGMGENGREGNWILNSVYARLHGAGNNGMVPFGVSRQTEGTLGEYHKAGRHLFRIQKRGDTLTFAVCVDFDGHFEPTLSKTIPDVRAVAPFLTRQNSGVFLESPMAIEAVRFIVDGKAVPTARPVQAVVATAPGPVVTMPAVTPGTPTPAGTGAGAAPSVPGGAGATGLVIVDAKWGVGNRTVSVVAILRDRIKDNRLDIVANEALLGDPAVGLAKQLTITYEVNGQRMTTTYGANEAVTLSAPKVEAAAVGSRVQGTDDMWTIAAVAGGVGFAVLLVLVIMQQMRLRAIGRQHAADIGMLQKQSQSGLEEIKQLLKKGA